MSAHDDAAETGPVHAWLEQAAAFAMGALDERDAAAFREHLASCEQCQREVRAMREVATLLGTAPPQVEPPPALRDRILAEARASRSDNAAAPEAPVWTARPAAPVREAVPRAAAPEVPAAPAARATPSAAPRARAATPTASVPTARRGGRAIAVTGWLAAAAGIAVAAYIGSVSQRQRDDLANYARRDDQLRQTIASRDSLLAARDAMISALIDPGAQTLTLASTGRAPSARLLINRAARRVVVVAYSLPSAPAGRTYQLWGLRDHDAPVSLGTFNSGSDARALAVMDLPAGVAIVASAVTEEPEGGSPAPTSTPFLFTSWKSLRS